MFAEQKRSEHIKEAVTENANAREQKYLPNESPRVMLRDQGVSGRERHQGESFTHLRSEFILTQGCTFCF